MPMILLSSVCFDQNLPQGWRLLKYECEGDLVDVVVESYPGQENIKTPLLVFCKEACPNLNGNINYTTDNRGKSVKFD